MEDSQEKYKFWFIYILQILEISLIYFLKNIGNILERKNIFIFS